ncbi:MAG: hypothetical protein JNK48_13195, partial [Bryobacterales bacterium]|nr:hypothetical protein [Bryobacterales bacterium]
IALLSEASELLRAAAEQEAADGNHARAAELYRELVEKAASGSKPEADLANACAFSRFYGRLAELTPAAESGQWKARRMALWSHWRAQLPANAFVAARAKQELGE